MATNRTDYILHPESGEKLSAKAVKNLQAMRDEHGGKYDVQVIVSDGLNASAIMDDGHLEPFLQHLHRGLAREGYRPAPQHLVFASGRVRAGYRLGESLYSQLDATAQSFT